VQGLGPSDCRLKFSGRNILPASGKKALRTITVERFAVLDFHPLPSYCMLLKSGCDVAPYLRPHRTSRGRSRASHSGVSKRRPMPRPHCQDMRQAPRRRVSEPFRNITTSHATQHPMMSYNPAVYGKHCKGPFLYTRSSNCIGIHMGYRSSYRTTACCI
jgi:hypothetical protein